MTHLITFFQGLPPELMMAIDYGAVIAILFALFRLFGREGLLLFIVLAIVLGNIEVLKATQLSCMDNPIALGTILFTCTYLATDILVEHYGPQAGTRAIGLGFAAVLMVSVLMTITIGIAPISCDPGQTHWIYLKAHQALETLFTPAPAILIASLISYGITQYLDVRIFNALKIKWNQKYLGLRSLISTLSTTFLDNVIFSVLAWKVLHPLMLSWGELWYTYIWGTYVLRLIVSFLNLPIIYLFKKKSTHELS